MKLWVLRPKENLTEGDNPWDPWYDKAFGFIVSASSEQDARLIAHENAGDENRGRFLCKEIPKTTSPWLDEKYSTCVELEPLQEGGMIMQDFRSA